MTTARTAKSHHPVKDALGINRTRDGGGVVGMWRPECDPGTGVVLGAVPTVPEAGEAFTAEELEARISHYRRRASRGLPLFHDGDSAPVGGKVTPSCWACGLDSGTTRPDAAGWWLRTDPLFPSMVETYCVACFDRWGWPRCAVKPLHAGGE